MTAVVVDRYCEQHGLLPCKCATAIKAKVSKYYSQGAYLDGHYFPSFKEARRYTIAKMWQETGRIRDLIVHPQFNLEINGIKVGIYTADLSYTDIETSEHVIEDTKSNRRKKGTKKSKRFSTKSLSSFRIKVFEAIFGVKVRIIL